MSSSKRILALAVALLMLLPVFSSCAGTDDPKPSDNTTPSAETTAAPDGDETTEPVDDFYADRNNAKDGLPEKMDFGGQDIRILIPTSSGDRLNNIMFFAESSTDVIEEAIYRRNEIVCDRLNVKMVNMSAGTASETDDDIKDRIRVSVSSFSDDYDLIKTYSDLMMEGYFLEITNLDYVDWDAPWWNQSYREAATVNGRLYKTMGELSLANTSSAGLVFFSKQLMQDLYGDTDLYQVVRDGNWTLDKMAEMCDGVYYDNNGDGLVDENDRFGNVVAYKGDQKDAIRGGANLTYAKFDEENGYYVWALENERTSSFFTKCQKLLYTGNRTLNYEGTYKATPREYIGKLMENTALFTYGTMGTTEYMREMPDPGFGIVPAPKLDEAQENYTAASVNYDGFSIPTTCQAEDAVGAFMEAASAQNYRTVTPAYFDTAVKAKYTRDEESAEMLDIIVASMTNDVIHVLCDYFEFNSVIVVETILSTEKNLSRGMSMVAKQAKSVNQKLQDLPDLILTIGVE